LKRSTRTSERNAEIHGVVTHSSPCTSRIRESYLHVNPRASAQQGDGVKAIAFIPRVSKTSLEQPIFDGSERLPDHTHPSFADGTSESQSARMQNGEPQRRTTRPLAWPRCTWEHLYFRRVGDVAEPARLLPVPQDPSPETREFSP